MDEFARRYRATLLARDFQPVAEPEAAAAPKTEPQGSRERAQANAPSLAEGATALMDTLAGALKGATAATMGLPGDLEGLVRLLTGGNQILPTTEDVSANLPPVVPDGDPKRQHTADTAQALGEFIPVAPVSIAKGVVKAVKGARGAKAAAADAVGLRMTLYRGEGEGTTPGYRQAGVTWTTPDRNLAENYASGEKIGRVVSYDVTLRKPFTFDEANAEQLARYFDDSLTTPKSRTELAQHFKEFGLSALTKEAKEALLKDGYDSIIVKKEGGVPKGVESQPSVVLLKPPGSYK